MSAGEAITIPRGRFIAFEGGEGAGKSTLARGLAERLRARGHDVIVTREPGGTPNAEAIRALLVEGETSRWSPLGETLLLYAAREDHVRTLIEPALAQGRWVISDRFADSTRAYQAAAGGLDTSVIDALHKATLGAFEPDLTLIVDLDPQIGLARTVARGEGATRFEQQPGAFHDELRAGFLAIAQAEPKRCAVIDGAQSPQTLLEEADSLVRTRLERAA
jgi:dTMP kinase